MRYLLTLVSTAFLALASWSALASQEGVLRMSEFFISSQGIGNSGPVRVSGTQGEDGISQLRVEAFGKTFIAPPATLTELRGLFANGILLSYEAGYPKLGGRTVYVSFFKGVTSGVVQTKRFSVNERGEFMALNQANE